MLKKLLLSTLFVSTALFAMHDFELNLNEKDVDLRLGLDVGQFNESIEPESVLLQFRLMKGDEAHASLPYSQDTNWLYEGGFIIQNSTPFAPGLTLGMGVKLTYSPLKQDHKAIMALPIGVIGRYQLPIDGFIPLYVGAEAYYAPEVLSFKSTQNLSQFQTSFDIELMERGQITTGYRWMNNTREDIGGTYHYNQSWYLGFRFLF